MDGTPAKYFLEAAWPAMAGVRTLALMLARAAPIRWRTTEQTIRETHMKILNLFERGLSSVAVWTNNAPDFLVGELSRDMHAADVDALSTQLFQLGVAEDGLHTARMRRTKAAGELRGLCKRGCLLIAGTASEGDGLNEKLQAVYRVRSESFAAVKDKGGKLVLAWQGANALRASHTPAHPPLLVGVTTVGEFEDSLETYDGLLSGIATAEDGVESRRTSLRAIARKVDRNNKRWHKAWRGQFAEGTPERAALRIIDTGRRRSAPGPAAFLTAVFSLEHAVRLSFGAARAVRFTLLHQGPGEEQFTILAEGWKGRNFEHKVQEAGEHRYKVIGHNAAGDGPESAVLVVQVAQAAAA